MKKKVKVEEVGGLKFYEFDQNNSGGSHSVDSNLCHRLIIEAMNENEACDIAEGMGVYFNGCDDGMDCPCCGDRWYRPSEMNAPYQYGSFKEDEAIKIVEKYGGDIVDSKYTAYRKEKRFDVLLSIENYAQYMADEYGWTSPDIRIFYKNGDVKEIESARVKKNKRAE